MSKMDAAQFKNMLSYQEPDFGYNGKKYSICSPDGNFYVTAEDFPSDVDLVFQDADDLLDHWIIQGKPLRSILPDIDFG